VSGRSSLPTPVRRLLLAGAESAGKTTLAAGLTGSRARDAANYRGSTVAVHQYLGEDLEVVDTPGILRGSDSQTTGMALRALEAETEVVAVVQATRADDDLAALLPVLAGRSGIVVLTHADRLDAATRDAGVAGLERRLGVPTVAVDARSIGAPERKRIMRVLDDATPFPPETAPVGWCVEPRPGPFERRYLGPALAAATLFAPAIAAVTAANAVAGWTEPVVEAMLDPVVEAAADLPGLPAEVLAGDYGVTTMLPLLFVWALPTVTVYALLLGAMKASGLIDRLTAAVDPLLRPVGLAGRDAVRVLMGFGCNVPAVISTRSCSSCTRDTTIAAIAFGAACSYQLGATLAVFAAAGRPGLVVPFLAYLLVTTLVFTRLSSPAIARDRSNRLLLEGRVFLQRPRAVDIWREASTSIRQFLTTAVPIFLALTVTAAVLTWSGLLAVSADTPALTGTPDQRSDGWSHTLDSLTGIVLVAVPVLGRVGFSSHPSMDVEVVPLGPLHDQDAADDGTAYREHDTPCAHRSHLDGQEEQDRQERAAQAHRREVRAAPP